MGQLIRQPGRANRQGLGVWLWDQLEHVEGGSDEPQKANAARRKSEMPKPKSARSLILPWPLPDISRTSKQHH